MDFERSAPGTPELNITPLIDIVFLLLIFFMLTSTLIAQEGLEVSLPGSESSSSVQQSPLTVVVRKDGTLYLNKAAYPKEKLQAELQKVFRTRPNEPVLLQTDSSVSVQQLVTAMDAIRNAGGSNISLATERPAR